MKLIKIILVIIYVVSAGCLRAPGKQEDVLQGEQPGISHARRFDLIEKDGCTLLRIKNPWQGADDVSLQYYLLKKGSAVPEGIDPSKVIFVPVRKVICMSVTHTAMISALGETESIAAVSGSNLIFSEELNARIKNSGIPDVGYEAGLNNELIIKISPDLLIMYGIGGESAGYTSRLEELGIKVLFNADYLETDPLGRAEWIKFFGALYCREALADSIFRAEKESYGEIGRLTAHVSSRPKVLLGLPYRDTWYISPGNSYISKMISDAGGEYLWKHREANESLPLGLENVYVRALDADFWLNISTASSKNDILAVDPRFSGLPCYENGNLYNNNKRINATGGNDYWETGTVFPHLILRDMAMIMHPELFGDHEQLYFYKKLQ